MRSRSILCYRCFSQSCKDITSRQWLVFLKAVTVSVSTQFIFSLFISVRCRFLVRGQTRGRVTSLSFTEMSSLGKCVCLRGSTCVRTGSPTVVLGAVFVYSFKKVMHHILCHATRYINFALLTNMACSLSKSKVKLGWGQYAFSFTSFWVLF